MAPELKAGCDTHNRHPSVSRANPPGASCARNSECCCLQKRARTRACAGYAVVPACRLYDDLGGLMSTGRVGLDLLPTDLGADFGTSS
jgi:hypothetical protein